MFNRELNVPMIPVYSRVTRTMQIRDFVLVWVLSSFTYNVVQFRIYWIKACYLDLIMSTLHAKRLKLNVLVLLKFFRHDAI